MEASAKKGTMSLTKQIGIALVAGIGTGILAMLLREHLNSTGQGAVWTAINNLLFQDITAAGAEKAIGLFYILGQMFIRAMQLVIVPMIFTSITMAVGQISDTKTLGRISFKTIGGFLACYVFAMIMACAVGFAVYNMGLFQIHVENIEGSAGSISTNPLLVILNAVPSNIVSVFAVNNQVLAIVFLAVALGLCLNFLGEEKTAAIRKLVAEVNDVVIVFLNFVTSRFAPIAIFMLLSRTFATYGIEHLRPTLIYVVVTVTLLLVFMFVGYPIYIVASTGLNPMPFARKITKVAIFGFSTSSSAAALPLNMDTTVNELGVDEKIASFVLPLGMTVNMNGTAIMQVIATCFIAGCAQFDLGVPQLIIIALLAMICSAGAPAAPGAGAIILFTILSGIGLVNDGAILAYSLILAINRPIEMLMTAINCVGDSATSIYVAKSEGLFDETVYRS